MKVVCREPLEDLKDAAIKHIVDNSKTRPVIVFNMLAHRARFQSIFKNIPDRLFIIETAEDVKKFKKISHQRNCCVILLHDDFAFGIDFRFDMAPMCVVFAATEAMRYLLRQMLGRAQRDSTKAECNVYCLGHPDEEQMTETGLKKHEGRAFYDGVRILGELFEKAEKRINRGRISVSKID